MRSPANMMLSLVPFWLILIVSSPIVYARPHVKSIKMMAGENHLDESRNELTTTDNKNKFENLLEKFNTLSLSKNLQKIPVNLARIWPLGVAKTSSQVFTSKVDPELMHKNFVHNRRRKRELRNTRKIASSMSQIAMPHYYPFIMAEMIPGSVKIRHPAIIAVNGCPAYFIADHTGRCRQVFQYTVQFGQESPIPKAPSYIPEENVFTNPQNQPEASESTLSSATEEPPVTTNIYKPPVSSSIPRPAPRLIPRQRPSNKRLANVLRNAAKKFNLSLLNNRHTSSSFPSSHSSSSGERINDENLEKLRKKILSALKITNSRSRDDSKGSNKKKDSKHNSDDDD